MDDLISALRRYSNTAVPPLVLPPSLKTELAATPEGQTNQVEHMYRELMQAYEKGRVCLTEEKLKILNRMEKGIKTLEEAQWVIDLYARHRVFDSVWIKPHPVERKNFPWRRGQ
jgi:hypothetical protein